MANTGVVIYSEERGVYLGHHAGYAFWSKLDAGELDHAPVFRDRAAALLHVASHPCAAWNDKDVTTITITPDYRPDTTRPYASVEACVAAGLPRWEIRDSDEEAA